MTLHVSDAVLGGPLPQTSSYFERNRLKLILIGGDVAAMVLGYAFALLAVGYPGGHGARRSVVLVGVVAVAGTWAVRSQELLLSRVSAVRVLETTRIARAIVLLGGIMLLVDRVGHLDFKIRQIALASVLAFLFLMSTRSMYRTWLSRAREKGSYCRRIVIVGTDAEALRLLELFSTHRDLGIVIGGIIGSREEAFERGFGDLWMGDVDHAETLIAYIGASGAVLSANCVLPGRLNVLIRNLHAAGLHVHLATGVAGIDSRRLRTMPLAHEPLLYVEPPLLSKVQVVAKRMLDISVATTAILLLSPVLAVVAGVIKLEDRGPVFFKQTRVGRGGRHFGVFKFRTMRVDAEKYLAPLRANNERQGPLFKMVNDPRVTKVGRFLRDSGIDELPQLINVLRGEMSLVGPRPALPAEVVDFSPALRTREQVLPGITGLWQVEARDNPSFEAYRRLDLFYVENWCTTLDLWIIVATFEQFATRLFSSLWHRPDKFDGQSVEPVIAETIPDTVGSIGN